MLAALAGDMQPHEVSNLRNSNFQLIRHFSEESHIKLHYNTNISSVSLKLMFYHNLNFTLGQYANPYTYTACRIVEVI
jgi:hypothetical protein